MSNLSTNLTTGVHNIEVLENAKEVARQRVEDYMTLSSLALSFIDKDSTKPRGFGGILTKALHSRSIPIIDSPVELPEGTSGMLFVDEIWRGDRLSTGYMVDIGSTSDWVNHRPTHKASRIEVRISDSHVQTPILVAKCALDPVLAATIYNAEKDPIKFAEAIQGDPGTVLEALALLDLNRPAVLVQG